MREIIGEGVPEPDLLEMCAWVFDHLRSSGDHARKRAALVEHIGAVTDTQWNELKQIVGGSAACWRDVELCAPCLCFFSYPEF